MQDLPIIQKTYDLIKWYVPILNRLPRDQKFLLGDRITTGLYNLLEGLIRARYTRDKLSQLELLNTNLDILVFALSALLRALFCTRTGKWEFTQWVEEEFRPVPARKVTTSKHQPEPDSLVASSNGCPVHPLAGNPPQQVSPIF